MGVNREAGHACKKSQLEVSNRKARGNLGYEHLNLDMSIYL
jgi:hypothetical protein